MKNLIKSIIHFFKSRYYAKPFNIWTECEDSRREKDNLLSADYISYDGFLYYGHPLFIFFKSSHNYWWKRKTTQ